MRRRKSILSLLSLMIGAVIVTFSFDMCGSVPAATPHLAVWSEFIPYAELESGLDDVKAHDLDLFVAFNQSRADFDAFAKLLEKAREKSVHIRPWLLLDEKDGYWFNKWNVEKNEAFVMHFLDEMERRGQKPEWIIFDLEPPQPLVQQLEDAFKSKNPFSALDVLKASARSASLLRAIDQTKALVEKIHQRGVKVHAVTANFVLNDGRRARIQNALGVPATGVPFDEISFMVYRPELWKIIGAPLGSAIVHMYADLARKKFGAQAGIDLGETGFVPFPKPFQGFKDPIELRSDLAAVTKAGVQNVHIYSLDGMAEHGLSTWLAPGAAEHEPPVDLKALAFMKSVSLLGLLLPAAD